MTVPLIGYVPSWILIFVVAILILYFFGKKVLHIVTLAFLAILIYWIIKRFI